MPPSKRLRKPSRFFSRASQDDFLDDARQVLTGGDTAATDYFKRTGSADSRPLSRPSSIAPWSAWASFSSTTRCSPAHLRQCSRRAIDIDKYVVGKTLDGLFLCREKKKRKSARILPPDTTALLKEVFGKR